jgi:hypothetical protein
MTDKQQPPVAPERIFVPLDAARGWAKPELREEHDIPYARVHPVDDGQVGKIRKRAEVDGYRKLTLRDGNTTLALVQARADVLELLSLLPQLSSSGPLKDEVVEEPGKRESDLLYIIGTLFDQFKNSGVSCDQSRACGPT